MEKIWLKSYPPGVPSEINPDQYSSITELFLEACRNYKNKPAYYNLGTTITFEQLDQYSQDFATYLQHELKVCKGDRVAIMLPNLLQYPIALFGILRAGAIVVNTNPLYTVDELVHQLNNSGAETILAVSNFASTVQKALPKTPKLKNIIITDVGDMLSPIKATIINFVLKYVQKKIAPWNIPQAHYFKKALKLGRKGIFTTVNLTNKDTAFLQYTGGTTGVSKGAILSHRNIIANILQAESWFTILLRNPEEIIITALPLYHIFSLTANCFFFLKIGGLSVLITNPRDIPRLIKDIKKFKFTAITGVNTLFNALLKNKDFAEVNFSHMHLALGGGMAVQRVVAEKWKKVTGTPLLEAYGLTETSPCVTINPANLTDFNGTIGLPVASTDVAILDVDGHEVPLGDPGELAVKGPQVMQGYWNSPEESKKVFTADNWLLTGDIASMDENGFVRLLERKKDMIIVSGFNVYPNEIEDVIARMPEVREVAVVAAVDENSGEIPKAFIVRDSDTLTEEDVVRHCRAHLTGYKIPKKIVFLPELPKTNVGKILRRALRDQA